MDIIHAFGLFCFEDHQTFLIALDFCDEENLQVHHFVAHSKDYLTVFTWEDYYCLLIFCQEEHFCFVAYKA